MLKVWMPYLRSPSTSARSLVMAMTVAKTVTKQVMNLHSRAEVGQECWVYKTSWRSNMQGDFAHRMDGLHWKGRPSAARVAL